jgi:oxygen-independent coproporphyrinogen-3 oxidase
MTRNSQANPETRAARLQWAEETPAPHPDPEQVFAAGLHQHHLANTAYPVAHRRTIWRHRREQGHAELLAAALGAAPRMGLYVHIPFCERRCRFCEYTVLERHDPQAEEAYHRALMAELELYLSLVGGQRLVGLDIGGGTPALVAPWRLRQLLQRVRQGFLLEPGFGVSIETTPRVAALHPKRLRAYKAMGIHRISIGLQLVNPRLLRAYGREINEVGHNRRAVDNIREAGFERLNIDLMYGLARQSLDDLRATLEQTIALSPEYITLYRMRYKGTRVRAEAARVDLDQVLDAYELARELLLAAGYRAQPGKNGFSRVGGDPGTSAYLTERVVNSTPYLGLGLGAQTFTNNILAYNLGAASKRLGRYLEAVGQGRLPIQDLYLLPPSEGMAKMISVSFYFGQIHLGAFRETFGVELSRAFPAELDFVRCRGLMRIRKGALCLTRRGARVFNGVVALFYSPPVKAHLLALARGGV